MGVLLPLRASGEFVRVAADGYAVAAINSRMTDPEAYAHAFAAAPDLLSALKKMLERESKTYAGTEAGREHFARDNQEAIAAIAKAEGRE